MRRSTRGSWWSLYALIPVMVLLLFLAARVNVGEPLHRILLVAIVVVVTILALLWTEQNADLMSAEGVNAQAEESELTATGIEPGRFAPSLTPRQARYRLVMFARHSSQAAHAAVSIKKRNS